MRYVLITSWGKHWDRVNGLSSYPFSMLKGLLLNPANLQDNTRALFIKVNKDTRIPEKCWDGTITKITKRTEKVWFQFSLERVVECPTQYAGSPDGWYGESGPLN